ncbi:MAG: hypothetical protein ACT4N4_11750 [Rhodospirillales bacterium]
MAAFLAVSQALLAGGGFAQVADHQSQGPTGDMKDELHDLLQSLRRLQTQDFSVEVRTEVGFLSDIEAYFFVTAHNAHRHPVEILFPPAEGRTPPLPTGSVVVGPGRTVVIEGLTGADLSKMQLREARNAPTLTTLPILGRLFSSKDNSGQPNHSLLILITPRLVR